MIDVPNEIDLEKIDMSNEVRLEEMSILNETRKRQAGQTIRSIINQLKYQCNWNETREEVRISVEAEGKPLIT